MRLRIRRRDVAGSMIYGNKFIGATGATGSFGLMYPMGGGAGGGSTGGAGGAGYAHLSWIGSGTANVGTGQYSGFMGPTGSYGGAGGGCITPGTVVDEKKWILDATNGAWNLKSSYADEPEEFLTWLKERIDET